MGRLLVVICVLGPAIAHAQAPGETPLQPIPDASETPPDGRDTHRWMIGPAIGLFASYPLAMEDPGAGLVIAKPLWLGTRYSWFQWALDANAIVGFGSESHHVHVQAGPQFGWNWYFGPVFGVEFRFGLVGIAQVGERNVAGLGISAAKAYVFRFWKDDRRRLKLWMQMNMGGYFAPDPGDDVGMNAGAFAFALAYEAPL